MFNISKKRILSPYPFFGFSVFVPRAKPTPYKKELVAYRKLVKEYRMKNIIAYWERQTKIENDFIGLIFFFNSLSLFQ